MTSTTRFLASGKALRALPPTITVLLNVCVTLIVGNAASLWTNLKEIESASTEIGQTWTIIDTLRSVQSNLALAESGQRGYLLSGDAAYLDNFAAAIAAIPEQMATLHRTVLRDTPQADRYARLQQQLDAKLGEMQATILVYKEHGLAPAIGAVRTDTGKLLMEKTSELLATMEAAERSRLLALSAHGFERFRLAANLGLVIGTVTLLILLLFYAHIARNVLRREVAETQLRAANETLEGKVAARTAQLSHLSRYLLQLAETEKAALARELHDELGANLTAINLDVTSVATRLQTREPKLADRLNRALKVLHDTVDLKRRIIQGLRPSMLDSLGLSAALRMHCEDFTRRTGLPCDTDCPDELPDVSPSAAIALYRVAQESLNNIAKYARANRVQVALKLDEQGIHMQIVDDGVGIDPDVTDKPMVHGILGMRERVAQLGGRFAVRAGDDGTGTIVEAHVPLLNYR